MLKEWVLPFSGQWEEQQSNEGKISSLAAVDKCNFMEFKGISFTVEILDFNS